MVEHLRLLSNQPYMLKRLVKTLRALDDMKPRADQFVPLAPRQQISRRLTPAQLDQLVLDYRAGSSTPQLAERYSISKTAVKRLLRERGIKLRLRGLSETEAAQALELRKAGLSLEAIGKKLGYSRKAVTNALRRQ